MIPFRLIAYGIAALIALAAIATVVYKVRHWCNAACVEQTQRADKEKVRADGAEERIAEAQKRASAMVALWDTERQARERDAVQREGERNARFGPVENAARSLPAAVARTVFPAPAARVLDDAIAAGNAAIARPADEPAKSPGPASPNPAGAVDVAGVTTWGVAVAALYAACADQVRGWQDFYSGLRRTQLEEQIH